MGVVLGEVLLQFFLFDIFNKDVSFQQIYEKFVVIVKFVLVIDVLLIFILFCIFVFVLIKGKVLLLVFLLGGRVIDDVDEDDDYDYEDEIFEDEDFIKLEIVEKRRRRLWIKGLKCKKR